MSAGTPSVIVTEADVTKYGLESPSICSDSVYFTPDGSCMTEINSCYQSTENLNTNINGIHAHESTGRPARKSNVRNTLLRRSISNKHLLNKVHELSELSIVPQDCIDIAPDEYLKDYWRAEGFGEDINNMSVTPSDFRGTKIATAMASTPLCRGELNTDKGIFHVARRKKVELHNLSPKVTDLNGK